MARGGGRAADGRGQSGGRGRERTKADSASNSFVSPIIYYYDLSFKARPALQSHPTIIMHLLQIKLYANYTGNLEYWTLLQILYLY